MIELYDAKTGELIELAEPSDAKDALKMKDEKGNPVYTENKPKPKSKPKPKPEPKAAKPKE